MSDDRTGEKPEAAVGRREFLTGIGLAGAAAASTQALSPPPAAAQSPASPQAAQPAPVPPAGYTYLKPTEAQFVEAVVDHFIPADELTSSGTDVGIATFIDRALAGSWGKGDRLYQQGPWLPGTPNQGYQLAMTPAELYRAGIAGSDAYCQKTFGKDFANCAKEQKEAFLKDMQAGKITLDGGLPGRAFFGMLYENTMEGLFADPIYGGNRDKIGWRMVGFPGVMANNAENIKKFNNGQRFVADPVSIQDMS